MLGRRGRKDVGKLIFFVFVPPNVIHIDGIVESAITRTIKKLKFMKLEKEDACQALIEGKLVIAYFGNNGDYKYNHLATPIEIRLINGVFCTYTSQGIHTRKLKKGEILVALYEKFEFLNIYPICILDKRPVRESLKKD